MKRNNKNPNAQSVKDPLIDPPISTDETITPVVTQKAVDLYYEIGQAIEKYEAKRDELIQRKDEISEEDKMELEALKNKAREYQALFTNALKPQSH